MAKLTVAASPRRGLRWVLFFLYLVTWHFVQKATLGIWMWLTWGLVGPIKKICQVVVVVVYFVLFIFLEPIPPAQDIGSY